MKKLAVLISAVMIYEAVALPLAQAQALSQAQMSVTPSFGDIVRKIKGHPEKPTIYHIQDIHNHVPAQTNLSAIVDQLEDQAAQNGKSLVVFVEGSTGLVESDSISALPNKERTKDIASGLINAGLLFGEEFAAVTHEPGRIQIVGVETPGLYNLNTIAEFDSKTARKKILKTIQEIRRQLEKLNRHNFNANLTRFETLRKEVENGSRSVVDSIEYMHRLQPGLVKNYPRVGEVITLTKLEDSLEFDQIETDHKKLVQKLTENATRAQADQLVARAVSFKEGDISAYAYYSSLLLKTKTPSKALKDYVRYLDAAQKTDSDKLFDDLTRLEIEFAQSLLKHDMAKELYDHLRWIERQEKFFALEMIPQEWREQRNTDLIEIYNRHAAIRAFVGEQVLDLGYKFQTPLFSRADLRIATKGARQFYRAAEQRDGAMVQNLAQALKKYSFSNYEFAFVAGGFHTDGIISNLTQKGLGVVVIRPQIETTIKLSSSYNFKNEPIQLASAQVNYRRGMANLPKVSSAFTAKEPVQAIVQKTQIGTPPPSPWSWRGILARLTNQTNSFTLTGITFLGAFVAVGMITEIFGKFFRDHGPTQGPHLKDFNFRGREIREALLSDDGTALVVVSEKNVGIWNLMTGHKVGGIPTTTAAKEVFIRDDGSVVKFHVVDSGYFSYTTEFQKLSKLKSKDYTHHDSRFIISFVDEIPVAITNKISGQLVHQIGAFEQESNEPQEDLPPVIPTVTDLDVDALANREFEIENVGALASDSNVIGVGLLANGDVRAIARKSLSYRYEVVSFEERTVKSKWDYRNSSSHSPVLSPNGELLATNGNRGIEVYNAENNSLLRQFSLGFDINFFGDPVFLDNNRIASVRTLPVDRKAFVFVLEVDTGKQTEFTIPYEQDFDFLYLKASANGQVVAIVSQQFIVVVDLEKQSVVKTIKASAHGGTVVELSPNGTSILVSDPNIQTVYLGEIDQVENLDPLPRLGVTNAIFLTEEIVASAESGILKIFNKNSTLYITNPISGRVTAFRYDAETGQLFTGHANGVVYKTQLPLKKVIPALTADQRGPGRTPTEDPLLTNIDESEGQLVVYGNEIQIDNIKPIGLVEVFNADDFIESEEGDGVEYPKLQPYDLHLQPNTKWESKDAALEITNAQVFVNNNGVTVIPTNNQNLNRLAKITITGGIIGTVILIAAIALRVGSGDATVFATPEIAGLAGLLTVSVPYTTISKNLLNTSTPEADAVDLTATTQNDDFFNTSLVRFSRQLQRAVSVASLGYKPVDVKLNSGEFIYETEPGVVTLNSGLIEKTNPIKTLISLPILVGIFAQSYVRQFIPENPTDNLVVRSIKTLAVTFLSVPALLFVGLGYLAAWPAQVTEDVSNFEAIIPQAVVAPTAQQKLVETEAGAIVRVYSPDNEVPGQSLVAVDLATVIDSKVANPIKDFAALVKSIEGMIDFVKRASGNERDAGLQFFNSNKKWTKYEAAILNLAVNIANRRENVTVGLMGYKQFKSKPANTNFGAHIFGTGFSDQYAQSDNIYVISNHNRSYGDKAKVVTFSGNYIGAALQIVSYATLSAPQRAYQALADFFTNTLGIPVSGNVERGVLAEFLAAIGA